MDLPVIGQGTWHMETDPAAAVRAIRLGLDLGMTHVDTAEMYGSGRVERIVGEAIAGRRDEVFLASKVLPSNASREGTIEACERSLRRLATDRLDLYLLHWPGSFPLAETFEAFDRLVDAGKVRFWGVSNFDEDEIAEAARLAGPGRIASNQVLYHADERAIERAVLPACRALGIPVVAYSPLGSGAPVDADSEGGRVLAAIAREKGATPAQVALAFLARHPDVFCIPKATSPDHLRENAAAGDLVLSAADCARIDEALPLGPGEGLPII